METKHTKGEWHIDRSVDPNGLLKKEYAYAIMCIDKDFYNWHIAGVFKDAGLNGYENEANAKLIAASPLLLDALKKFAMLNEDHYKDIAGLIINARNAIKKATL